MQTFFAGTGAAVFEWRLASSAPVGEGGGGLTSGASMFPRVPQWAAGAGAAIFGPRYLGAGGVVAIPYVLTEPFKDWGGNLLPLATIPGVLVVNPATRAVLLSLADQVTRADARLRLEDAALPTGQPVVVVSFNSDGSARGVDTYTVQ